MNLPQGDSRAAAESNQPPHIGRYVMTDGNNIVSRVAYKVNGGISIYTINQKLHLSGLLHLIYLH